MENWSQLEWINFCTLTTLYYLQAKDIEKYEDANKHANKVFKINFMKTEIITTVHKLQQVVVQGKKIQIGGK